MSIPPNYNVITQPFGLDLQEYLNKTFYDQAVTPYTTAFADFYAVMPSNNATPIAVGADVAFPSTNATSNSDITRLTASTFQLGPIGIYQVAFSVPVDISGQLVLTINNVEKPLTVVGRLTIASPISGQAILTTTAANSVLTVRNPAGSVNALPISVAAGGTNPVTAHLVITRLR